MKNYNKGTWIYPSEPYLDVAGDTSNKDDVDWAKFFSADPIEREQYKRNLYGGENPNGQQMQTVKWNKMADISQRQDNTRVVQRPLQVESAQRNLESKPIFNKKDGTYHLKDVIVTGYIPDYTETDANIAHRSKVKKGDKEVRAKSMTQPNKTEMNNLARLSAIIAAGSAAAGAGALAFPYVGAAAETAADWLLTTRGGQFITHTLQNPYFQSALDSYFVGHGLNHAINDGIDGWGDAALTALELAPGAKLMKPMAGAAFSTIGDASKYLRDNVIIPYYLSASLKPQRIDAISNAFRNQEWSNFLATINGDNYYRLSIGPEIGKRSTGQNYFISHTTPWEEFSGKGTHYPIAHTHLYEFPTRTFGKMKSSGSHPSGGYSDYDVTEMGKKHLLYGETSSGPRGFVRALTDKDAELLGVSPFEIGVSERPTTAIGLYDRNPIYDYIHAGNQTIVDGAILNDAVLNTTYNMFEKTPFGILRTIHLSK